MSWTYLARIRKDKGIKTIFSSFPKSMWDKVGGRRKNKRKLVAITITSNIYAQTK